MGIESLAVPPGAACRGDSRFGGAARSSVLWLDSKFGGASRGGGQHAMVMVSLAVPPGVDLSV